MKDIQVLRVFARVARLGNFSAGARECGLAQSQVSRMIADLEAGLGVRLLLRTTRTVVPTEAGSEFLARIEPILIALDDAAMSVREGGELHGLLRVGMPASFGNRIVLPALAIFAERHPKLTIQILLEDKIQDMVREAIDVGIRIGALPDAAGTSKLIGTVGRVVVAAPSYLAKAGTPMSPEDLHAHRIVGGPSAAQTLAWQFERGDKKVALDVHPKISVNDTAGAVVAAANGLGITSTTTWACEQEIEEGTLVRILRDWRTVDLPVHAYFPMGRSTRLAARAFIEFLAEQLAARVSATDSA